MWSVWRAAMAGLTCALMLGACTGGRRDLASPSSESTAPCAPSRTTAGSSVVPASTLGPRPEARSPRPDVSSRLTPGGAIEYAASENPRLAAARNRWRAATQRPAQARALPDPLLLYTEAVVPIQTRGGPIDREFQLLQRIPYPGKLSAAGAIAEEQARVSRLDYEIALRDTVAEVKVTYAELAYLHQALAIVEQNQAIAKQLTVKAATAYAGAEEDRADPVTLFDTLQAQSQLAQLSYDTVTLQELLVAEEARMNGLLHRSAGATLGIPEALAYRPLRATREQLIFLGRQRSQELEAAIHKIRAAEQAERLARLSRVPDFTLGAKYAMVGSDGAFGDRNGEDALGVTFGMTLPIWECKNRAKIAEAEYLKRAACLDRQAKLDDLATRITRTYFRLQNAARLVELYRSSIIPQAEDSMRIAEAGRDAGRDTYGRLLEAQSVWLNFRLAYHRALADHEQMVVRLEQLVGTSLSAHRRKEGP